MDFNLEGGCWVCGKYPTERHHVWGASNKKISDKYGFIAHLCADHHRGQPNGIHGGNIELSTALRKYFQTEFEKEHLRFDFEKMIGRNYLD